MKKCQKTLKGFVDYLDLDYKIKLNYLVTFSLIVLLELLRNHIILTDISTQDGYWCCSHGLGYNPLI